MEFSKRTIHPRLDQLLEDSNDKKETLDEMLSFPIEAIKDSSNDLKAFMSQLKECCNNYTTVLHDCICALYKCGSIAEANELKKVRDEKKSVFKERFAEAESFVNRANVSTDASQIHGSHNSLNSAPAALECSTNIRHLGISRFDTGSLNGSIPHVNSSVRRTAISDSFCSASNVCNPVCNNSALSKTSSSCSDSHSADTQIIQDDLAVNNNFNVNAAHFTPRGANNSNTTFAHKTLATNHTLHSTNNETDLSLGATYLNSNGDVYSRHSFANTVPATRNNPIDALSNAVYQGLTIDQSSGQPNTHSSRKVTFASPNSYTSARLVPPQCNFDRTSEDVRRAQCDTSNSLLRRDSNYSISNHVLKQELFHKPASPYTGEPQRFNSWLNSLLSRMSNLNLSAWDRLLILEAHTAKEPQRLVQRCMALGGLNPERALESAMNKLRSEFGSSIRVANALNQRLDSFPPIRSVYDVEKLKDLLEICEFIDANISSTAEFYVFNSAYGARKVWLKLPESLQNNWRSNCQDYRFKYGDVYPPFSDFVQFLAKKTSEFSDPLFRQSNYFDGRKKTALKTTPSSSSPNYSVAGSTSSASSDVFKSRTDAESSQKHCPLHESSSHALTSCRKFEKMPHKEKLQVIRDNKLCYGCLGNHLRMNCTANAKCEKCKGKHLTMLHFDSNTSNKQSSVTPSRNESSLCTNFCNHTHMPQSCSKVLLVDVLSNDSKSIRCYAILDEQSSSSFADPKLAEAFEVHSPVVNYNLKTLSGSSTETQGVVLKNLRIRGVNEKKTFTLPTMYTNPFIPDCKAEVASPKTVRSHPQIRHLANRFNNIDNSAEVLLLLGRDTGDLMFTRCYGNRPPFAHRTSLGWALVGLCSNWKSSTPESHNVLRVSLNEHFLQETLFKHSRKEFLSDVDVFTEKRDDELPGLSNEDRKFLEKVEHEINVNESGNIVLPLPFRNDKPKLPDNHVQVFCRTKNALNRLAKDERKLEQSLEVMGKYLFNGHVEVVPDDELKPKIPGCAWWLPVFAVTHPKKKKVRIVFDSSAKYHGTSLNDQLIPGPDINNKLTEVLIGFRNGHIGFAADIETMFHNFHLRSIDKDYLRFYWYRNNDSSKDVCQFRANVHIFGNCCSPALTSLGLHFAACSSPNETVHKFVKEQFYVDDGLYCSETVSEAVSILQDTRAALSKYNIRLHKICSSSKDVVNSFPASERASRSVVDFDNPEQSALGLTWNVSDDRLVLRSDIREHPFTRRGVLATVNAVFDPLRISSPLVLGGKIIQRKLLLSSESDDRSGVYWDTELSEEYRDTWNHWKRSLCKLSGLSIPRGYMPCNFGSVKRSELHGFCDASNEGTGYVIYIRVFNGAEEICVSFVCANSKIAPRKPPSIPRMELCAALDLSLSLLEVSSKLEVTETDIYLYSDSMITLGYINNSESRFSRYVSRRINLILKCFSSNLWFYVARADNPADIASRQQTFETLTSSCWLSGPQFLRGSLYPDKYIDVLQELPEVDKSPVCLSACIVNSSEIDALVKRCSSLTKLVRCLKLVLLLAYRIDVVRQKMGISLAPRPPPNSDDAMLHLIKEDQYRHFANLHKDIPANNGTLTSLSPFIDAEGVVRVGGRLALSNLEYENKYPILLANKSALTLLIIDYFHSKVKHQGRCLTLSAIRDAGYYIHKASLQFALL